MHWLLAEFIQIFLIAIILFVVAALLAPYESLGWWAGWSKRSPGPLSLPALPALPAQRTRREPACYLVFLSGVGITDVSTLTPKEQHFLDLLAARLPQAALVHDIFPYSAINNALTGQRRLRRFWRWVKRAMRHRGTKQLYRIVALRNELQVAVSADRRYGPVFNFGVARGILLSLLRHGYRPYSQAPIILIGVSGSGQIAVGSGAALHRLLEVPVWVVSIGGVLTSDPSILEIEHVFHLSGSHDRTQHLGMVLYPGCWPIMRGSAWNRALAHGKRTLIPMGPMKHMSHGDYFSRSMRLPSGAPYVEHTVAVIAEAAANVLASATPGQLDRATRGKQHLPDDRAAPDAQRPA